MSEIIPCPLLVVVLHLRSTGRLQGAIAHKLCAVSKRYRELAIEYLPHDVMWPYMHRMVQPWKDFVNTHDVYIAQCIWGIDDYDDENRALQLIALYKKESCLSLSLQINPTTAFRNIGNLKKLLHDFHLNYSACEFHPASKRSKKRRL